MSAPRYVDLLRRLEGARAAGVELGLERVRAALGRLGDPQKRFAAVQVAGTNGKGSTAAMAEAIWRASGVRTGLYTSPHLCRFTERMRVAGIEADGDRLAALDARVAACGVPLTYFEIATVLAFLLFAEEGVELGVLETGLGGRLDAVTTCEPAATAITSIGLDHPEYLGGTLREVAREKAGIIKPGVPVVLGPLPPDADEEVARAAEAAGAPLLRHGRDFAAPDLAIALPGPHQRVNAAVAVALVESASGRLGRAVDPEAVAAGLSRVRWPARLERVGGDILLDAAHNVDGARALATALPALAAGRKLVLVVALMRDKDAGGVLAALGPLASAVVVTRSANPRSIPPDELAALARTYASVRSVENDPRVALAEARYLCAPDGLVVVTGSIFLAGEIRAHLLEEPVDPVPTGDPV